MPRKYNMANRSKNGAELRRRIVEATAELHDEKGILATSIQDVAERADVAPNTVYRYFPTYNDVVRACGAHFFQMIPPPDEHSIVDAAAPAERIEKMVKAWFAFYEAAGEGIELARQALVMPAVAEQLEGIEAQRRRQVNLAVGAGAGATHTLLSALTTLASWRSFEDAGTSAEATVGVVVDAVIKSREKPRA